MAVLKKTALFLSAFFLLSEIVSQIIFFGLNRQFFFNSTDRSIPQFQLSDSGLPALYVIHPFYGAVLNNVRHSPANNSVEPLVNNLGFKCPFNYPYPKKKDDVVIAVAGGSVAWFFYLNGTDRLKSQLIKKPSFKNKNIVFLNYAVPGFKQPQQLMILNHMLSLNQELDYFINIDGFNEVVIPGGNAATIDHDLPGFSAMLPQLTDFKLAARRLKMFNSIQRKKEFSNWLASRAQQIPSAFIYGLAHLVHVQVGEDFFQQTQELAKAPATLGHTLSMPLKRLDYSKTSTIEACAQFWKRSSELIREICRSQHIRYIHVLQPNQYFTRHPFAPEEKALATDEKSPVKPFVEQGYPLLKINGAKLKSGGETFLDATTIFDETSDAVFIDNTSHYTQKGNDLLAEFIAKSTF